VIDRRENGAVLEPAEYLILEVDREFQGATMELLGNRGAEMKNMETHRNVIRFEYIITARALIGFKSDYLTQTRGTGLMHHSFHGYVPKKGERQHRANGVLIAKEKGATTAYALDSLQERSVLFVGPGVEVYEGMIVGMSAREYDMVVNPSKKKALTNMRAAGSDDTVLLTPPKVLSLEQAIEFIEDDELVEVTPESIRLRKRVMNASARKRGERS
jgi:GTP-binding protein